MMQATQQAGLVSPEQVTAFERDGYLIVPQLFTAQQVAAIRARFEVLAQAAQPIPGHWEPDPRNAPRNAPRNNSGPAAGYDPLKRYPRVMHPHRFDELSRRMLLHSGVHQVLKALMHEEPVACQSMFYYKPPGARGQALHQDNFYLEVRPRTCYAAWLAVDRAHPGNGGLYLVPGSQNLDILCPEVANDQASWTTHLVNPPKGMKAVPAELLPGDVLFFNGSVIHGSGPNRSQEEWRRSWICHYMPASTTHVSRSYFPIFDFQGRAIVYEASAGGGPCGEAKKVSSYDPYGA